MVRTTIKWYIMKLVSALQASCRMELLQCESSHLIYVTCKCLLIYLEILLLLVKTDKFTNY